MSLAETPHDTLIQIVKEKHEQIFQIMKDEKIDCWLTFVRETDTTPDPVQNLVIGGDVVWESAFIFYYNGDNFGKLAIVGDGDANKERGKGLWDEVLTYIEGISSVLFAKIKEINPEKIALNYSTEDFTADGLSYGLFLRLTTILDGYQARFVSAQTLIQAIRSQKSKTEVELITKACELTEEINRNVSAKMRVGMSEIEIQELYYQEMDNQSVKEAWEKVGCPAVDAGPDKEFGHVPPSHLLIQTGHTLHNDFGVKYQGYCSDIQRMWLFGSKSDVPEELQHAFDAVHTAITKAADFIKPGVKGYEVDKIAREYITSKGYEEYQHALGHQLGTKAHDGGTLLGPFWEKYGKLPDGVIKEGNVFTLELGVMTKNYGMVSLEEDIVVTADGCKFLVPRQMEWIFIN
ncbi:MAG: M24 family metallopeptidase [Candidatus Kariarchaeaceae archaeon]